MRVGNVLCDVHPFIYILGCTSAHAHREVLEHEHSLGCSGALFFLYSTSVSLSGRCVGDFFLEFLREAFDVLA